MNLTMWLSSSVEIHTLDAVINGIPPHSYQCRFNVCIHNIQLLIRCFFSLFQSVKWYACKQRFKILSLYQRSTRIFRSIWIFFGSRDICKQFSELSYHHALRLICPNQGNLTKYVFEKFGYIDHVKCAEYVDVRHLPIWNIRTDFRLVQTW